jgi:hypothetical protein
MRSVVMVAIGASLLCTTAMAATKLGYGSRAGMEVTVVSEEGLDTERAVIRTKLTREDATKFCVEYVGEVTPKCINDELSIKLNDRVTGNCKTGEFFDFYGNKYRFEGIKRGPREEFSQAKYALRDLTSNEVADGSSASGYPVNMGIFQALCPKTAPAKTDLYVLPK